MIFPTGAPSSKNPRSHPKSFTGTFPIKFFNIFKTQWITMVPVAKSDGLSMKTIWVFHHVPEFFHQTIKAVGFFMKICDFSEIIQMIERERIQNIKGYGSLLVFEWFCFKSRPNPPANIKVSHPKIFKSIGFPCKTNGLPSRNEFFLQHIQNNGLPLFLLQNLMAFP